MLKMLALGALGYAGYRYYQKNNSRGSVAFARNQSGTVRDAGPEAMRSDTTRAWTKADEASDESFPASDPPATY